ncbi:MAG: metal dependent phosphohydrolase [Solirubrobacterales bacterium]|jgi:3'-5' exoribonuclease|nr:metal dependent phosphohydrolase [Solirubrobacterales bacterium]
MLFGSEARGKMVVVEAAVAQIHPQVAELRSGQRFEGRYACLAKERLTARNGSSYLSLRLRDRSGTIAARVFRDPDRIGLRFEAGDAVIARGKVERYRGELAAELDDVRRLEPGSFDPGEFLPAAYRSVEELEGFLEHLIREIHDPGLRAVVESVVVSGPLAGDFRRAPATRASHHAYLGGLLEHTVAVGTLVGELCPLHPRLDSDLLMAAAIVHDAGRAREFTYGADFGISEEGRMLGHLAIGAELVGSAASSLPEARRLALLNCVLSHHGPDSGPGRSQAAARGFASPEALALYRLNALDASVKGALEHG